MCIEGHPLPQHSLEFWSNVHELPPIQFEQSAHMRLGGCKGLAELHEGQRVEISAVWRRQLRRGDRPQLARRRCP